MLSSLLLEQITFLMDVAENETSESQESSAEATGVLSWLNFNSKAGIAKQDTVEQLGRRYYYLEMTEQIEEWSWKTT